MLKYIKNHAETILGIELYPLLSFIIFFTFFVLMTIYIMKVSKKDIDEVSRIPLDTEKNNES